MLSAVLKDENIQVTASFMTADPGVAYILAHAPTLAVVEMMLPVLHTRKGEKVDQSHPYVVQDCKRSFEAVRDIHRHCPKTKILMLTGERHPHNFLMAFEAGADGIACKIDGLPELVRVLRRVMSGERRVLFERMQNEVEQYLASPIPKLTKREVRILELVQEGAKNPEIARRLGLAPKTVRNVLNEINQKLGTHNRIEASEVAIEMGIVGWRF